MTVQCTTNQIAAFLHYHSHARVQKLYTVVKQRAPIEMIAKHVPCNMNCNVTSLNYYIPAEQFCVLQVTRPRGWLHETSCTLAQTVYAWHRKAWSNLLSILLYMYTYRHLSRVLAQPLAGFHLGGVGGGICPLPWKLAAPP